jgi:release factor glutamine methyltransferase
MAILLRQAIREAAVAFRGAGIHAGEREALALAAWAAGMSTAMAFAHPERELTGAEEERLRQAVKRRAAREPFAYVTGHAEFYGLEFVIDRRVLVPRPETEHVVEQALAVAREFERPLVADIGTGSGCIAVAIAHTLPQAVVYATDSSPAALEVAAANARRHDLDGRVRLLHGDLLAPLPEPVHVIACNPPYIATEEFPDLMPEVRDYEPRSALDGGEDGLAVIREVVGEAPTHLLRGGTLVMEIGASQGAVVRALAERRFASVRIERDLAGLDRVLVARMDGASCGSDGRPAPASPDLPVT